jgi:excisionase family DNA binding protein
VNVVSEYVGPEVVARYLDIGVSTLRAWCRAKRVPHYRKGRKPKFVLSEIDEWMSKSKIEPKS